MFELKKEKYLSIQELLNEWKEQHNAETEAEYIKYKGGNVPKKAFLPDGIIDSAQFIRKKDEGRATLFVAKEAYWFMEDETEESCMVALENPIFWHREVSFGRRPETMFSKRLSMLINSYYADDYETIDKEHTNLQSCSLINLNKRGGFAYCKWETLAGYVSTYCRYIEKEIELIAPNLIICCGKDVKWLLDKYINIDKNIKVVTVSHPSYFALSDAEYINQLGCVLKNKEWALKKASAARKIVETPMKGIMFDTNKSYSDTATFDMLTSEKICAYDGAGKYIESFNNGDTVFYYVKGLGVVAAGEICSETNVCDYYGSIEKYKMVKMISPVNIPDSEEKLMSISPSRIKELLDRNFYWASTIKTPFLDEEQSKCLISELKKLYKE